MKQIVSSWIILGTAALLVAFTPLPTFSARPTERLFRVEAGDFAYFPAVLIVNPGDRVTIELISTDVVHGLYLDGYDLNITADPGQTASLTFFADKSGMFRIRCSVTCGALHPFMAGKLQVGSNPLLWRGVGLVLIAFFGVVFIRQPLLITEN